MGKEDIHSRLIQSFEYLRGEGVGVVHTQTDFAKALGMKIGHLNNAMNGDETRLTKGLMKKIAKAYPNHINEEWLLTGEGKMEKPARNMRPHYPATVEAGVLGGAAPSVMDYEVEMEPVIKRFPYYDYMIDVSGQSMEPTYFSGDMVACRNLFDRKEITPGKVYVIATHDGAVIKRLLSSTLSSLRVSSDNPEYKPYNIDRDNIVSIAEVVGSIRTNQVSEADIREAIIRYAQSVLISRNKDFSEK